MVAAGGALLVIDTAEVWALLLATAMATAVTVAAHHHYTSKAAWTAAA